MKTKLIVASKNKGKIKEVKEILDNIFDVQSIADYNIDVDVEENQNTFAGNSKVKAIEISKLISNELVIADDSGIEIDYLDGAPGVFSKRWFPGTDRDRNNHILELLTNVPKEKRKIKFICAISVSNGKETICQEGILEGYVSENLRGDNGFGFDEIFELENGKTLAELTDEEKNDISARKIALEKIKKILIEEKWG